MPFMAYFETVGGGVLDAPQHPKGADSATIYGLRHAMLRIAGTSRTPSPTFYLKEKHTYGYDYGILPQVC